MTFSKGAERLAGLAGALLGWRPDEFWRATPAELRTIIAAFEGPEPEPIDLNALMEMFPDG